MMFPRAPDGAVPAPTTTGAPAKRAEDPGNRTARLLLVDDDSAGLALLCRYLNDYGFMLDTATSGSDCLSQVQARSPDLILLDISMPPPDGFAVLTQLRYDPVTSALPVILLTGRRDAESKVRAFELGAVDYLTKPVEESELHARVTSHLARARLTRGLMHRLTAYESRFGALDMPAGTATPGLGAGVGANAASRSGNDAQPGQEAGQFLAARDLLASRLADPPGLEELADRFGMTQRQFARGFRALFGTTVHAWVLEAKVRRACELLSTTSLRVKTIAYEVGYCQTSDLTRAMVTRVGMTPTAWRARARD